MDDLITSRDLSERAGVSLSTLDHASKAYHWERPEGTRGIFYLHRGIVTPHEYIHSPHKRGVSIKRSLKGQST